MLQFCLDAYTLGWILAEVALILEEAASKEKMGIMWTLEVITKVMAVIVAIIVDSKSYLYDQ